MDKMRGLLRRIMKKRLFVFVPMFVAIVVVLYIYSSVDTQHRNSLKMRNIQHKKTRTKYDKNRLNKKWHIDQMPDHVPAPSPDEQVLERISLGRNGRGMIGKVGPFNHS